MKNIAEKLDEIIKQTASDKAKFEQLSNFEDTMNTLQSIMAMEKPTYNYPQVDTIGKQTYSSLNKK